MKVQRRIFLILSSILAFSFSISISPRPDCHSLRVPANQAQSCLAMLIRPKYAWLAYEYAQESIKGISDASSQKFRDNLPTIDLSDSANVLELSNEMIITILKNRLNTNLTVELNAPSTLPTSGATVLVANVGGKPLYVFKAFKKIKNLTMELAAHEFLSSNDLPVYEIADIAIARLGKREVPIMIMKMAQGKDITHILQEIKKDRIQENHYELNLALIKAAETLSQLHKKFANSPKTQKSLDILSHELSMISRSVEPGGTFDHPY